MKKYFLILTSLLFIQAPTFADDLDAQPDQTYSSPAPLMEETPPGGEITPEIDTYDEPVDSGDSCPFDDGDDDDIPTSSQHAPEKYAEPDDQG